MDSLSRLRERMDSDGISAMMISDPTNVGWVSGFSGTFGRVLVTASDACFITDSRYKIQAAEEVSAIPIKSFAAPTNADEFVSSVAAEMGVKELGFESATTTHAQWTVWVEKFANVELLPVSDVLLELRMTKTPAEIAMIRAACGIADAAFDHIVRMIQPGVTEYDLCLDLEFFIRRQGADVAFPSIVVSGDRSARPHGKPSEKKLEVGDFVTMDFGARLGGYNSDITRTVVVGEATDRHRQVYSAVLEAQIASIAAIRSGKAACDVDALARETLAKHDLAKYFGHGLGHGLGRIVHDGGRLSASSKDLISPGQVWTIEPGVYIEGFGGVRIEDDVLITDDGIEVLTSSPKELMILPAA